MYIRLVTPYHNCEPGDVIDLPATVARQLVSENKAHGGHIDISKVKPLDYMTPTKIIHTPKVQIIVPNKVKPKPTDQHTVKEIKKWLDSKGIAYPLRGNKKTLLKIVNE